MEQAFVFVDYQNQPVDFSLLLEKLKEQYRVMGMIAYGHWEGKSSVVLSAARNGVDLIELPEDGFGNNKKNDIRMIVDAVEMIFTHPHISTFVLVTGDLDFCPLVLKLRERGKRVATISRSTNTSPYLRQLSDQFIAYDYLVKEFDRYEPAGSKTLSMLVQEIKTLLEQRDQPMTSEMVLRILRSLRVDAGQYGCTSLPLLAEKVITHSKDVTYLDNYRTFAMRTLAEFGRMGATVNELWTHCDERQKWTPNSKTSFSSLVGRMVQENHIQKYPESDRFFIPAPYRWKILLRENQPYPEHLEKIIDLLFPILENGTKTLKEAMESVAFSAGISQKELRSIAHLLKFCGCLVGPDQSDYVSFSTPVHLRCAKSGLLHELLKASIKRLMKRTSLNQEELESMLRFVGGERYDQANAAFQALIQSEEVLLEQGEYTYCPIQNDKRE